jgi:hypothetical protein
VNLENFWLKFWLQHFQDHNSGMDFEWNKALCVLNKILWSISKTYSYMSTMYVIYIICIFVNKIFLFVNSYFFQAIILLPTTENSRTRCSYNSCSCICNNSPIVNSSVLSLKILAWTVLLKYDKQDQQGKAALNERN